MDFFETHLVFYDKLRACVVGMRHAKNQAEQTFWHKLWVLLKQADDLLEEQVFPTAMTEHDLNGSKIWVGVRKASGVKCARCWLYSLEPGHSFLWPDLCNRCETACQELFDQGKIGPETLQEALDLKT